MYPLFNVWKISVLLIIIPSLKILSCSTKECKCILSEFYVLSCRAEFSSSIIKSEIPWKTGWIQLIFILFFINQIKSKTLESDVLQNYY